MIQIQPHLSNDVHGDTTYRLKELYRSCQLCEWRCGVNRNAGHAGRCGVSNACPVFRMYISFAEEIELIPALMVYLGGCNLRCRFCTQAPQCYSCENKPDLGDRYTVQTLLSCASGVRWINWVGGEPSLHLNALYQARDHLPGTTPWLLNTNGWFTLECFELLDPLFDLYVVDFKFGNDTCAATLAGVPQYVPILQRNLLAIFNTGTHRLLVRHLLMPGHEKCCYEPIARWIANHLPGVRFNLMSGYVPGPLVTADSQLGATVPTTTVHNAFGYCRKLGLNRIE